mmetsp:Transcript_43885/g.103794  ORF Transcript_43885/g.103794 Transcript_43885/m.103794 type:complete len:246 (+) Transcript_43885:221-958(+)
MAGASIQQSPPKQQHLLAVAEEAMCPQREALPAASSSLSLLPRARLHRHVHVSSRCHFFHEPCKSRSPGPDMLGIGHPTLHSRFWQDRAPMQPDACHRNADFCSSDELPPVPGPSFSRGPSSPHCSNRSQSQLLLDRAELHLWLPSTDHSCRTPECSAHPRSSECNEADSHRIPPSDHEHHAACQHTFRQPDTRSATSPAQPETCLLRLRHPQPRVRHPSSCPSRKSDSCPRCLHQHAVWKHSSC